MDEVYIMRVIPSSGKVTYYVCVPGKEDTSSIFATTENLTVAVAKAERAAAMLGKKHNTPKAKMDLWEKFDKSKVGVVGGMFEDKAKANG